MKNLMSKIPSLPLSMSVVPIALLLVLWTNLGILPILDQSIVASKYLMVLIAGALILTWYFIHSLKKGSLSFIKTPFTLPLSVIGIITAISIFANNAFPVESLLGLGGVTLSLTIIMLKGSLLIKNQTANGQKLLSVLGISTIALLTSTALQHFGYGPSMLLNQFFGLNLPNNELFNLAGSNLVALQVTIITAVGFSAKVVGNKKAKPWESFVLALSAIAIVYYGWLLMPNKTTTPIILSPTASWSVAMSSVKSLRNTLLGFGPDNYLQAFNQYKPAWINNSQYWSVQFSQAANLPLSMIVTTGIFGLIGWIYLMINALKQTSSVNSTTKPLHYMLLVTFLLQLLMPINIILLTVQAVIVVFWVGNEKDRFDVYNINLKGLLANNKFLASKSGLFIRLIIGLLTIGSLALLALVGVSTYSSYLMYQSSKATTANNYVLAYELQQQAIKLNPYLDSNRRKYAVTNIVIAAAISQKADLTEDDKQKFAQLIQQSIRESKAAILLDNKDVANWQLAAQVYQTLIGVAENSEEWAVSAYAEAVKLAPNNPELRLVLGGVLFNAKQYEDALKLFEQSVALKPNYANGYYNGANTLKMLGGFDQAKVAYQKTLMLLQPDSEDYLKAAGELQELEKVAKEAIEKQAAGNPTETLPAVSPVENVTPTLEAPPTTDTEKSSSPSAVVAE